MDHSFRNKVPGLSDRGGISGSVRKVSCSRASGWHHECAARLVPRPLGREAAHGSPIPRRSRVRGNPSHAARCLAERVAGRVRHLARARTGSRPSRVRVRWGSRRESISLCRPTTRIRTVLSRSDDMSLPLDDTAHRKILWGQLCPALRHPEAGKAADPRARLGFTAFTRAHARKGCKARDFRRNNALPLSAHAFRRGRDKTSQHKRRWMGRSLVNSQLRHRTALRRFASSRHTEATPSQARSPVAARS